MGQNLQTWTLAWRSRAILGPDWLQCPTAGPTKIGLTKKGKTGPGYVPEILQKELDDQNRWFVCAVFGIFTTQLWKDKFISLF